jgi:hypothetical protein
MFFLRARPFALGFAPPNLPFWSRVGGREDARRSQVEHCEIGRESRPKRAQQMTAFHP